MKRERVAVVGGGVAGLAAAWVLGKDHDITLIEAANRLGGHACPVEIKEETKTFFLDTAFLIFNSHSYPSFLHFLKLLELDSAIEDTDMSIGFHHLGENLIFAVNCGWRALFPVLSNLFRPRFLRLLGEIQRFRKAGDPEAISALARNLTLEQFLAAEGFSDFFAECFAYPLGASVWSLPPEGVKNLPAILYFSFFNNHKILKNTQGARWQIMKGSSAAYLERFRTRFSGTIRLGARVESVSRDAERNHCLVKVAGEKPAVFDRVVIATHADTALRLLASPTQAEREILEAWEYRPCETILHTDEGIFPAIRGSWASWNIATDRKDKLPSTITYYLNRIQKIHAQKSYFVSWGGAEVKPASEIARFSFRHPSFTPSTQLARLKLPALQSGPIVFCGSYFGDGFHEDAVRSAFSLMPAFGLEAISC